MLLLALVLKAKVPGLEGGPLALALNACYDFVFDTSRKRQNSMLHWCDGVC